MVYPGDADVGVPTLFSTVNTCSVDLAIALEDSTAVCDDGQTTCENWGHAMAFVRLLVEGMNIGPDDVNVCLLLFSRSSARVMWDLNR